MRGEPRRVQQSRRTAWVAAIGIVVLGATAVCTRDVNLTGLVGVFISGVLGTLSNRHMAADIAAMHDLQRLLAEAPGARTQEQPEADS